MKTSRNGMRLVEWAKPDELRMGTTACGKQLKGRRNVCGHQDRPATVQSSIRRYASGRKRSAADACETVQSTKSSCWAIPPSWRAPLVTAPRTSRIVVDQHKGEEVIHFVKLAAKRRLLQAHQGTVKNCTLVKNRQTVVRRGINPTSNGNQVPAPVERLCRGCHEERYALNKAIRPKMPSA